MTGIASTRWIDGTHIPDAGGKATGLARLVAAGVPVPPAFVVTADAFRLATSEVETDDCAELRRRIYEATAGHPVLDEVARAYADLAGAVAVRSSASTEDSAGASFAGEYDTYLWVEGAAAVAEKVRRCWASLYNDRAVAYRRSVGLPPGAMAVVVQRMVDADAAGVLMTLNPVTGDRSSIVVEGVWGLGEALVSGAVTPDRFVLSKVTGEVLRRELTAKPRRMGRGTDGVAWLPVPPDRTDAACLTDDHLARLWRLGRQVEDLFGGPVDIEYVVAGDDVLLVQARPETVWRTRSSASPAAAAERPTSAMSLILNTLTAPGSAAGSASPAPPSRA